MAYEREREGFRLFRDRLRGDPELRVELERAVEEILDKYDTAIRENRFVVGGVIEHIVGVSLRACGVGVRHRGLTSAGIDLIFEGDPGGYSVKSMFRASSTRLVNVLGRPPVLSDWCAGTLFLVQRGIVYADPELPWWKRNLRHCVRIAEDALQIRRGCVEKFILEEPDWLAECRLPGRRRVSSGTNIASADLAAQVLMRYHRLFDHLPGLIAR